jgi:hypothetical protein
MKTLVQKVFGNTVNSNTPVQGVFPNSKLQEVSRELQKKLEAKRAAELTDDQKIAIALAALRAKSRAKPKTNHDNTSLLA